jgi:HTH-type transcriptional regulator / antitoxin HigA
LQVTDELSFEPDWFSRPADTLLSLMRRRGISADRLAERIDGGMIAVRGIVAGEHRIDDATAAMLADEVGGSPGFWIRRQANYERALERAVLAISPEEAEEWLQHVPAPGARPHGRLSEHRRLEELRRRLAFFGVSNLRAWHMRYGRHRKETLFRTSPSLSSDDGAVSMWLRRGELEAGLVSTGAWRPNLLWDRLPEIRRLSRISRPSRFLPRLKHLYAEAGVALVILRTPPGCRASGASRLISPDKAMMLLSFRYRADDQFWFTVLHETGHLLLHGAETFIDDSSIPDDEYECEANDFASSLIVPTKRRSEFEQLAADRDSIMRFAVSIGVAPGLIVGQMQHRGIVSHERLNSLKRRWTWADIGAAGD